jgi:ribonuclease HI
MKLDKPDRVQLIWVPGHRCIDGSEIADQLVRMELECPFIGPELAHNNSAGVAKKTVRA